MRISEGRTHKQAIEKLKGEGRATHSFMFFVRCALLGVPHDELQGLFERIRTADPHADGWKQRWLAKMAERQSALFGEDFVIPDYHGAIEYYKILPDLWEYRAGYLLAYEVCDTSSVKWDRLVKYSVLDDYLFSNVGNSVRIRLLEVDALTLATIEHDIGRAYEMEFESPVAYTTRPDRDKFRDYRESGFIKTT